MKDFYEEANKIVEAIKALDFKEIGWLLEQAEKAKRYENALIEIMLIHNYNGLKAKGIAEKALKR